MGHSHRMKMAACAAAIAAVCLAHAGPVSVKPEEIERLRALVQNEPSAAAQFAKLHKAADEALTRTPNPVETIVSAGVLASDPKKIKTVASLGDMARIQALAWTAVVTGDQRYWAKTRDYVLAWATTNRPDGNPINDTTLEPLIEAYDITRQTFGPQDREKIDAWLRRLAERILKQDAHQPQKNWESHRIKLVGLAGLTLQDSALVNSARQAYMKQIESNFDATGSSIDFKQRDALHYHIYAVRPLLTFACAERRSGDSIFTYKAPNGASIDKAVDFVRPFALGEKTHTEFQMTKGTFDKERAAAGESEYKPHVWEPRESVSMFVEAGCLNTGYDRIAATVLGSNEKYVSWRSVLNTLNLR